VLENERHDEVQDDGRTHRKEREVNEIHADACSTNAEFAAPPAAHAESALLEPAGNFVDEFYSGHGFEIVMLRYKRKTEFGGRKTDESAKIIYPDSVFCLPASILAG